MRSRHHHGHTLAELMTVCAVLAVAAAIALPSSQPVINARADAAGNVVVQALRFARQDAIRTGALRMLRCDQAHNQLSVYVPKTDGTVAATVNHPLNKMNYTVNLGQAPAGSSMALTGCSFQFADKSSATTVAFDATGTPVRGTGKAADLAQPMSSGSISFGDGRVTSKVTLEVTGRVTRS